MTVKIRVGLVGGILDEFSMELFQFVSLETHRR